MGPASACLLAPTFSTATPEHLQQTHAELSTAFAAARSMCTSPADQAEVARVEACLAQLSEAAGKLAADAAARRAAAATGAASLKGDPAFAALAPRLTAASAARATTCEEAERAARERWPDQAAYESRCQAATGQWADAWAALQPLLTKHGVDARDAGAFDLY